VSWYVKTDGSADNDGMTWETATTLHNLFPSLLPKLKM
jgi:hypothetical protein